MAILRDGFRALIAFSRLPGAGGATYLEVTIKLPAVDGRGGIDQTNMRNALYMTKVPHYLIMLDALSGTMMYDSAFYSAAAAVINRIQSATVTLPDGGTVTVWGWLNKIEPTEYKEGERPLINFEFQIGNLNDQCVETPPVYTSGSYTPCKR
jgi:hypothetical protein